MSREVDGPSDAEREAWTSKLNHYHRAEGHPSHSTLIHLFRDAGLPRWGMKGAGALATSRQKLHTLPIVLGKL